MLSSIAVIHHIARTNHMSAILKPVKTNRLSVELTTEETMIRESLELRYRIFAEEMGANLDTTEAIDKDRFDAHCYHLVVRDTRSGDLIASTRLLTDEGAADAGSFYSETEFDMQNIKCLNGSKVEVGRTCVDARYRSGAAIAVLWQGLSSFIQQNHVDYLFGCASIDLREDDGIMAIAIMNRLRTHAFSDKQHRVTPKTSLSVKPLPDEVVAARMPPLLKAYVRLGAKACGEACWDEDFGVADVFMLLDLNNLDASYSRHFMSRGGNA